MTLGSQETDKVVCVQELEKTLEPVLFFYKQRRQPGESLGDFTARVGFPALQDYSKWYLNDDEAKMLNQVLPQVKLSVVVPDSTACDC